MVPAAVGSLYNYYRDELNDDFNLNIFANNQVLFNIKMK